MAMASPSPQQRAETPPPRRRGATGCQEDHATQQQVWSAKPGSENDDWTSSPLPRPRETFSLKETKDDAILSPKAKAMNLIPVRVDEDACFSSPKVEKCGYGFDLANDSGLFTSPQPGKATAGKENRQPGQTLAAALARPPLTPLKTPSRLPTVQEHEGQTLPLDEHSEVVGLPAWVVQTPTPAVQEELSIAVHDLGLSPAPPGLEDVKCDLPKPTNKNTFIQFVSPLKTFSVMSPPKTEPVNFAPSASVVSTLFRDSDDYAMSYSPMPWCTHEQIPCFPAQSSVAASMPLAAEPDLNFNAMATEPRQKGPVVRLAEFLPDPPSACQPSAVEQAFWNMSVASLPMPPMMPGTEMPMQFATGMDSMTAPSAFTCPTLPMMPDALTAQTWQLQQQMQQSSMQPQMQMPLLPSPPMHASEQLQQLSESQVQHPQSQLQMPSMQPQLLQPQVQSPQMQLPQMQPPPMPPPQMHAPTLQPLAQAPQPPLQAEQLFLQQLMQLQMAPPTWPPMQPPQLVAGEQVPAPPPQAPMEAPSVLCPSTCHQAGVCRCGEGALFSPATSPSTCCAKSDEQSAVGNGLTAPILLSAAMFPEMGASTVANNNRQRL